MSKLSNGLIPPKTICPFDEKCPMGQGKGCPHRGKEHSVAFSCAIARAFDIMKVDKRK